jgi:hypothetical protein
VLAKNVRRSTKEKVSLDKSERFGSFFTGSFVLLGSSCFARFENRSFVVCERKKVQGEATGQMKERDRTTYSS